MTAKLDVSTTTGGDGPAVVAMAGEFDLSNAELLNRCLAGFDPPREVVLDMASVDFMDSTILAVIALAMRRGLRVSVRNQSESAHKALEVSGLEDLLPPPGVA